MFRKPGNNSDQVKDPATFTPIHLSYSVFSSAPLRLSFWWRQRGSHSSEPSSSLIFAPSQAITPNLSRQARLPPVCPVLQFISCVNFLLPLSEKTSHLSEVQYLFSFPVREELRHRQQDVFATPRMPNSYSFSGAQPAVLLKQGWVSKVVIEPLVWYKHRGQIRKVS